MRVCSLLKIALREDDAGSAKLRLTAEDVAGETVAGKPIEPGLYGHFLSRDAFEKFAPRVIARLQKTPAVGHDGHPVVGADGKPAMVLPPDATLSNIDLRILC